MDYEFFAGLTPRIIEVAVRDRLFWEKFNYEIQRNRTTLHSLAYVLGGEGQLTLGGKRQPLKQGDLFQVWPGEAMTITSSHSAPLHYMSYQFQCRCVYWESGEMLVREVLGPLPLELGRLNHEAVKESFQQAYEWWLGKNVDYEWQLRLQFLQTIQLIHELQAISEEESSGKLAVHLAIQYMKAGYQNPLTRELLADHVSLSPGYFSVLFKEHTGVSPIRYLNKIRIDHAKQLLRSTAQPIAEVAEACGFTDSFYFSRLFQRETGMPPREYRKS
ncbi:helix-turn-helix domain-containing protein [Paenibacillus sp. GCM10023252]|uniref:helix-turn-helix domain-containing protein n=1 Tax=Paenibacillus sp. GCM10023252 TaxID=3252649 RepID=UPI003617916B